MRAGLTNQGKPNIWHNFSRLPFRPAVGEKSDRMTKKLARIPEFGFNPNPRPRPWSTPKFWLGSFGLQSKQTLNFHSQRGCDLFLVLYSFVTSSIVTTKF
jgi:hypothetical protein